MVTLKEVSTYNLIKEIDNEKIKQLFRTYEINDYQSLYHTLIYNLIPSTKQIQQSYVKAKN